MKTYTDPAKIKRLVRFYVEEVLPGHMEFKDITLRFGLTPNAVRYQLKKEGVWRRG
jgi:hypothetical protein